MLSSITTDHTELPSPAPISPFDQLAENLVIPKGCGAWTLGPLKGAHITCEQRPPLFRIKGEGDLVVNTATIGNLIRVARWREPDIDRVDLSSLEAQPELFALSFRLADVKGWIFPVEEGAAEFPGLNPRLIWLRLDRSLLGISPDLLPEECCLRHLFEDTSTGDPVVVDSESLFPGLDASVWMATLLNRSQPTPSKTDDVNARVRLLDFLAMNKEIGCHDQVMERNILNGDFKVWRETLWLSRSLDPSSIPLTLNALKVRARIYLHDALRQPSLPEWTHDVPLTEVWDACEWSPDRLYDQIWPTTHHAIDFLFSQIRKQRIIHFHLPLDGDTVQYLMKKVEEHPEICCIKFPHGVSLACKGNNAWRAELGLAGVNELLGESCKALSLFPSAIPVSVYDNSGRLFIEDIHQALIKICSSTQAPLVLGPKLWHFSHVFAWSPFELLDFLPRLKSLHLMFDHDHQGHLAEWKRAIEACPSPEKITLRLAFKGRDHEYLSSFRDLPVKRIELVLGMGRDILQGLTRDQGAKVNSLTILKDVLDAARIDRIPFSLFPNLKKIEATVDDTGLAALKRELLRYPTLKSCVLKVARKDGEVVQFGDRDLPNLPRNVRHLTLYLENVSTGVTAERVVDYIEGYPSKISVLGTPRYFSQNDAQRISVAWKDHNGVS